MGWRKRSNYQDDNLPFIITAQKQIVKDLSVNGKSDQAKHLAYMYLSLRMTQI